MPAAAHWPPLPRKSYYDGRPNAALMPCWTCQAQTAAATGCPRSFIRSARRYLSQKQAAHHRAALNIDATCAPRRPRIQDTPHEHARRTTRGFAPAQHIRSATAPERRRRARGPSPSRHRTSRPQAKERENDGRYPCLRWPGRAFAWGTRGKLAQVKLIKPAPRPPQQREDGPTRPPTRPSAPA